MRKFGALKIVGVVFLVLLLVAGIAGYVFGRKALSGAPAMVQKTLKEQGIDFKYKSAQLVPVGVGVVFDGLSVQGKVLPYEVTARQARLGLGLGFSLPPIQLTFNLVEPVVTENDDYVAAAPKAKAPPSEPPPAYLGWGLALVQARFQMENGQAEPFGVGGINALVSLSKVQLGAGKLERIEVHQDVTVKQVKAIDEKLGWSPGVSSKGHIAYLGNKVTADKLDLGVGPLITRVSGEYALDSELWKADVSVPSTNLKEATSFLTGPAKEWVKSMSGSLGIRAKASGKGADAKTVRAEGNVQGKKVTIQFAHPRVGGEARIDTDLDFKKTETFSANGTVDVDLSGTELKQEDLFVKKDGVPASLALKVKTDEGKLFIEKGTFKFHNLNVEANGDVTTNDNPVGQIAVTIAPTTLSGWEKFFPKYSSLKTSGTVEGKLDFAGPFQNWQQGTVNMDLKAKEIVLPILKSWVAMKEMDVGGIVRLNSVTQASLANGAIRTLNSETELDMKDNHLAYGKAFEKKPGVPMGASFSVATVGSKATIRKGNFVLGSFQTSLTGAIENFAKPRVNLTFSSPATKLNDLMNLSPLAKENAISNVSGTVALKGTVTGPLLEKSSPPQVKGDLTLSKVALDYVVAATKKTVKIKNLSGPITFSNNSVGARKLVMAFPQTDAVLDLQVASFDKPNITFNLAASRFQMNDFYETKGKAMGMAPIPGSTTTAADKAKQGKEADFRKNPYVRNTRMNGSVALRNADLGYTKAESITAKVVYDNLELRIEPVVMKVWGGTITTSTRWDGRPTAPQSKFTMKTVAVDANQFVGSWSDKASDVLAGRMDTDLNVAFSGMTAEEIKKSTKGGGNFTLNDGEIKTMKFSEKPLEALKKIPALSASIQKTSWQEKFNQFTGSFTIEDGKIKLNNPQVKSSTFDIVGSQAEVDFDMNINARLSWIPKEGLMASNQLDMLRDDSGRPSVPLAISGPIRSPSITVDMSGMEQRIKLYAQRKLEAEVKNKLQKEVEDKLKGGLQNLFK